MSLQSQEGEAISHPCMCIYILTKHTKKCNRKIILVLQYPKMASNRSLIWQLLLVLIAILSYSVAARNWASAPQTACKQILYAYFLLMDCLGGKPLSILVKIQGKKNDFIINVLSFLLFMCLELSLSSNPIKSKRYREDQCSFYAWMIRKKSKNILSYFRKKSCVRVIQIILSHYKQVSI